jgi:Skp family chaperone for outer membrane proteins
MKYLEEEVVREREDRIRDLDNLLAPIEDQIAQNNKDLDEERNQRVTNERMILDNLAADAKKIEDTILQEQQERQEQQSELVEKLGTELNR